MSDSNDNRLPSSVEITGPVSQSPEPPVVDATEDGVGGSGHSNLSLLITLWIVLASTAVFWFFRTDISEYGTSLMTAYGQDRVDLVLLLITSISCTPIVLPVWCYIPAGLLLGYGVFRLALVMALGSAVGSMVTFAIGRYFANTSWAKRRFPGLLRHRWTHGKSKKYVSWVLLLGTASPIPCDVIYAASGAKHYPALPFFLIMVAGRLIRYVYLGWLFNHVV